MNFISVTPHRDDGRVVLRTENVELQVPDRLRPAVQDAGDDLTAGFRPEHFEIVNGQAPGEGATLRATVDVVEFLGNEELLHVTVGEHDLVAIVDASHRVRHGDVLDLFVPLEKIHIFEPEGQSLASAGAPTEAAKPASAEVAVTR